MAAGITLPTLTHSSKGSESGPSFGIGPSMSDFFPWLWAPDSSKILMMPEDGSTPSAYLIDPESGDYSTVPWESGSALDWQRLAP